MPGWLQVPVPLPRAHSHTDPLYIVACTGAKAGVLLTPAFVNSSAGATYVASNGQWLDNPDAALIGDVNGSSSNEAVLLSLGTPTYDAAAKVLHTEENGSCVSGSFSPAFAGVALYQAGAEGATWAACLVCQSCAHAGTADPGVVCDCRRCPSA